MDVQARAHWVDYSRAKDEMFAATHTKNSPWYVVSEKEKQNLLSPLKNVQNRLNLTTRRKHV
jgi:polyphosphate kinase 2 (PPK2 family)